jgi:hypothetical protein
MKSLSPALLKVRTSVMEKFPIKLSLSPPPGGGTACVRAPDFFKFKFSDLNFLIFNFSFYSFVIPVSLHQALRLTLLLFIFHFIS